MTGSLDGRVAAVFGAAGGIGSACAHRLAEHGASLLLVDASADGLASLAASLPTKPLGSAVCDVRDPAQIAAALRLVEPEPGRVDVLVNTVGMPGRGSIDDVEPEKWDTVLAVNLTSVFSTCRAAMPYLRRSSGASIVNIASVAGLREQPGSLAYSAAKGGVVMFSRTLAADLAAEDIRVFAVCPTTVDTELVRPVVEAGDDPVAARAAYEAGQPMGRLLDPAEVAAVVVHLCSGERHPYTREPMVV